MGSRSSMATGAHFLTMADIALLRYRVTVQTRNAGQGPVSWSNTATLWAQVDSQQSSTESETKSGLRSTTSYLVRVRNDNALTPEQRLVWNGITLQILGVRTLDLSYDEAHCVQVQ